MIKTISLFFRMFTCLLLTLSFLSNSDVSAQIQEGYVVEGESFDGIVVGKSTESDVIASYGTDFRLIKHGTYSSEMVYLKLGLTFYYCQGDSKKEIFSVNIQQPYRITTKRGIILGESTFADIFQIYGDSLESSSGFEYKGITFLQEPEDKSYPEKNSAKKEKSEADESTNSSSIFVVSSDAVNDYKIDLSGTERKITNIDAISNETELFEVDSKAQELEDKKNLEKLKKKIVLQIDLFEKNGSRQCHVNPQGKK